MQWRKIGPGLVVLLAFAVNARPLDEHQASETFAIRAKCVYTLSDRKDVQPILKGGMILVEDGRIAAVGEDLEIPEGVRVLDFDDEVIVPGLVAADSALIPARGGKETVSAKYHALDGFDMYHDNREALAGGITTAYLHPGRTRLVSGLGATVKLAGEPGIERVLKRIGDLCVNLGDSALRPPPLQEYPLPPSSVKPIPPSVPQRPTSRLGQYLEVRETFEKALTYHRHGSETFDYNLECLGRVLAANPLLRIEARRAVDIRGALDLLKSLGMKGYLTGGLEAHRIVADLKASGMPIVLEVGLTLNKPGKDRGFELDLVDERLEAAALLERAGVAFAITASSDQPLSHLRLAAAAAVRGGLCPLKALEAVTRRPAEILGVSHRVGSLIPGKDADFVVLSGEPLSIQSHVLRVFSSGREVFSHPTARKCTVIRAGRVLTGVGDEIENGEILIRDGKIDAVGAQVPHPPGARYVDAGPDAVVTPGFIDGHGHLGLEGDTSAPGTEVSLAKVVAVPGRHNLDVARAGVTSVVLAPRGASGKGSQVASIRALGKNRSELVVDDLAALKYTFCGKDPVLSADALRSALKAGKKYADDWNKYFEALKKWKEEQRKKAETPDAAPKEGEEEKAPSKKKVVEEVVEEKKEADPITGTWQYQVSGGPLPEPQSGEFKLKLVGTAITGTGTIFISRSQEVPVTGTLKGTKVHLEIDAETPMGKPTVEADLVGEDRMSGEVVLGQYMTLQFEAERIEKAAPVLKVTTKKKKRGEGGRPEPPKLQEGLEPYRKLMAGEICALVDVRTSAEIEAVIQIFVDEYKVPLGLLGAEEAYKKIDRIKKAGVSVVVPNTVMSKREGRPYVLAGELAGAGIQVIFQSGAGDGARTLPLNASYFVHQGVSPMDALAALTVNTARLYRIDDRVGSIEKGKDADLVIHSGDPFELGSQVLRVYVFGEEVKN